VLLNELRAVHGADTSVENEFIALDARPTTHRDLAAPLKSGEQGAFGDDRGAGGGVIEHGKNVACFGIRESGFDADGALTDGGHANFGSESFRNSLAETEAIKSGFGNDDGIVLAAIHFAKSRVHVAAKVAKIKVGTNAAKLRLTAEAAGTHARAMLQTGEDNTIVGDERVTNIISAANGGKTQTRRRVRRNIFDAVNSEIDGFIQKRFFKFFDENAFAADLGKRGVLLFVADGLDDDDFGFHASCGEKLFADRFRLPLG
jgi:hypothetical protein